MFGSEKHVRVDRTTNEIKGNNIAHESIDTYGLYGPDELKFDQIEMMRRTRTHMAMFLTC